VKPDSARLVYEGDYLGVSLEVWDGREREIVERPDVVAVVAVDTTDSVVLVRQVRPPARRALLELPAGRVESDEDPLASARRELAEETGLRGGSWRAGTAFWTTPGFCRERVHLFYAEGLEPGEPAPDDGEELEVMRVPLAELGERLETFEDGKTIVGLCLYLRGRSRARA
jgi:ADP-ribose diphosphatase